MIKFGIVGIGGFAGVWVRSLRALEEQGVARLEAAVVRNRDKYAEQVARMEAEGRTIYASLDDMLAAGHGTLDVIGAPTGIAYHEPMAVQTMEAGYNVVIEKPVAGTVQEAESIAKAEERTGRWCAVGYQQIYSPSTRWLCDKLQSGALGALREAYSVICWPRGLNYYKRNPWAGQLRANDRWILDGPATNATAHHINNLTYAAQAVEGDAFAIASVRGELYRSKAIPSYDTSCIEIITARGTRLCHYVTHACVESTEPQSIFHCENGSAFWYRPTDTVTITYKDGSEESYSNPDPGNIHPDMFAQISRVVKGEDKAVLCGLPEASPHVLAIDLAFESSRGIIPVAPEHTYTTTVGGSPLLAIHGVEDALLTAFDQGCMLSDLDLPWAKKTAAVNAAGYTRFPSEELGKILSSLA